MVDLEKTISQVDDLNCFGEWWAGLDDSEKENVQLFLQNKIAKTNQRIISIRKTELAKWFRLLNLTDE